MTNHRRTAIIVGVLFIVGTALGILSALVTGELLATESPLASIAANPAPLRLGALFVLVMGLALAAMPLFLYPLLRRQNETLAMGMVVFRGALEGTMYLLIVVNWLLLSGFGAELAAAGDATAVGTTLVHASDSIAAVLTIVFIIGAVFLYTLLHQTRLIPRWLSLWGLIGAAPYLAVDLLKFFGIDAGWDFLYAPLAVQEMVMALWLIVRGFDRAGIDAIPSAGAAEVRA